MKISYRNDKDKWASYISFYSRPIHRKDDLRYREKEQELNKWHIVRLILAIEIVVLLGNAATISRDHQDSWVLEGLEVPFVLFVVTYVVAFFSEKKVSSLIALSMVGSGVFLAIPNLKYVWFSGTASDQFGQYGLANYVYNHGYIATRVLGSVAYYTSTPLIHILFATFSTILNIQVADSMKYLPVLLLSIYPLLVYSIVKNLKIPEEIKVLKYALFVSSIPIFGTSYFVTGSLFGILLSFLVLYSLIALLQKKDRRYWFFFIFFISVLAATHSVSSMLLTIFLSAIILLQKVPYFGLRKYLKIQAILAVISISVAWLVFQAQATLKSILHVASVGVPSGETPLGTSIPLRFFELAKVDILGAIKVIIVLYGADVFLLLLTLAGLIILWKMRNKVDNNSKFLFLFTSLLFLFLPLGFLAKVGGFRVLRLMSPLFPIFVGLLIMHLNRRKVWLSMIIFSSIIFLATLQLYSCQPLIPSANVLSKDLPVGEPIFYVTRINSIYQREMTKFAQEYVNGRIACDGTSRNQILGLAEYNFSIAHVIWWKYYPLEKSEQKLQYDFFLIHIPGVSGPFQEQAEFRTRDVIVEAIEGSSIVYTNGESWVLLNDHK